MKVSEDYKSYIEEQFSAYGDVDFKKMFGGYGIFREGIMFAMISPGDIFRMRADENNVGDYQKEGMQQFLLMEEKKECHIGMFRHMCWKTRMN